MEYKTDLYKVVSGNAFSQLGIKKIGQPVWLGPWHLLKSSTPLKAHNVRYNKSELAASYSGRVDNLNKAIQPSQAHNVYYNKSELTTTYSITKAKDNLLNRLVKHKKLSIVYTIFSFITMLIIILYCFPLLGVALGVYL